MGEIPGLNTGASGRPEALVAFLAYASGAREGERVRWGWPETRVLARRTSTPAHAIAAGIRLLL